MNSKRLTEKGVCGGKAGNHWLEYLSGNRIPYKKQIFLEGGGGFQTLQAMLEFCLKLVRDYIHPRKSILLPNAWHWDIQQITADYSVFTSYFVILYVGRDCAVDLTTFHVLDPPGMESRWRWGFPHQMQTGPGGGTTFCTMYTRSLSWGQRGRGLALTTHSHLVPRLKKE
jgi:hypothetical protein